MSLTYQEFLSKHIDPAPFGFSRIPSGESYFCTPEGAHIFADCGVDGIHFCFVPEFGEMVFAVSPMNCAPDYVHPLAENFEDFLRLLLACGDVAALEQAWQWDKAGFDAFLAEYPPKDWVMKEIGEKLGLSPMEQPYEYLMALQGAFDYSKIPYSAEYYDTIGEEPPAPVPEWEVYFNGNFWGHHGEEEAGEEVSLNVPFRWANHEWLIPAVYLCEEGLVVDLCCKTAPQKMLDFMKKWDLTPENEHEKHFTPEERMLLERENPVRVEFHATALVNGRELRRSHGSSVSYIPLFQEGFIRELEANQAVEHYNLDPNFCWNISRWAFPWANGEKPAIDTLSLTLEADKSDFPGPHFQAGAPGDSFTFTHPFTGAEHTLTVQEYETKEMSISFQEGWIYPSHVQAMTYTFTPELPDGEVSIRDCAQGDRPRRDPNYQPKDGVLGMGVSAVGVIGGADGPPAVFISTGGQQQGKVRPACSALHFEPQEGVEWRMIFHRKEYENTTVTLI